jgi:hypothetical protein
LLLYKICICCYPTADSHGADNGVDNHVDNDAASQCGDWIPWSTDPSINTLACSDDDNDDSSTAVGYSPTAVGDYPTAVDDSSAAVVLENSSAACDNSVVDNPSLAVVGDSSAVENDSPPSPSASANGSQMTAPSLPLCTIDELVAFNSQLRGINRDNLIARLVMDCDNVPDSVFITTHSLAERIFDKRLLAKLSYLGTFRRAAQKWSADEYNEKFRFSPQSLDVNHRIEDMLKGKLRVCEGVHP